MAGGRRDVAPPRRGASEPERASGLPIEPRNLNRSFERICKAAGIRLIRVHDLRHTTATLLKALGVPAKDAQVILGHARYSTTQQIYTHVDEAAMRDALTKLNRLLGGDAA